jgi:hypothetical protein
MLKSKMTVDDTYYLDYIERIIRNNTAKNAAMKLGIRFFGYAMPERSGFVIKAQNKYLNISFVYGKIFVSKIRHKKVQNRITERVASPLRPILRFRLNSVIRNDNEVHQLRLSFINTNRKIFREVKNTILFMKEQGSEIVFNFDQQSQRVKQFALPLLHDESSLINELNLVSDNPLERLSECLDTTEGRNAIGHAIVKNHLNEYKKRSNVLRKTEGYYLNSNKKVENYDFV